MAKLIFDNIFGGHIGLWQKIIGHIVHENYKNWTPVAPNNYKNWILVDPSSLITSKEYNIEVK